MPPLFYARFLLVLIVRDGYNPGMANIGSTLLSHFYGYIRDLAAQGQYLLWPSLCPLCGQRSFSTEKHLCDSCWRRLGECITPHACPACGREVSVYAVIDAKCPVCRDDEYHFDAVARAGMYRGVLRDMLLGLKYSSLVQYGYVLSEMIGSAYLACGFRDEVDYFVPVPLHWKRLISRGFNQADLIVRSLKQYAAIDKNLVRTRNTSSQWTLSPAKRKRNVKGAFAVRKGHPYDGASVCLVDDIATSRATINECARVLKLAGAVKVYALTAASAESDTGR